MDVASLVVIYSCIAQLGSDRYGSYGTTPPAYTAPATLDPIFTAAAPKKNPPPPATTATKSNTATASNPSIATPLPKNASPAVTPTDKSAAGELIREAIVVPQSLSVAGRGTSLYETLSSVGDRRRQLDAVRSYWTLATELAEYHFAWQQTQFLEHLQKVTKSRSGEPSATGAEINARLASARAQQRESEMKLNDAQTHLSEIALTASGAAPLPVDLPHVGTYRTQFERVYTGRAPSARAHALNRTLPLRKEVVDIRADGVWAAQDAYEAAFEAYQKGQLPIEEVLTALDDFRLRRSEFVTAVRHYNDEIAEYALLSAPGGIAVDALVGMLIKNPVRPAPSTMSATNDDGDVVPAGFAEPTASFQPMPDAVSAPVSVSATTVPSAASVAPSLPTIPQNELPSIPAASPPQVFTPPASAMPLPAPSNGGSNPLRGQPTLAPPQVPTSAAATPRYKVNKIPLEAQGAANGNVSPYSMTSSVVPVGYYSQLVSLPPAERAQDLIQSLYAPQAKSDSSSQNVSLSDCLAQVDTAEQPRVVSAYWKTAEQAARWAACSKTIDRLEALSQAVLRMSDSPAKTAAMLRVRSARLAAEADRIASRASLEADRTELTEATRRSLNEPWLLPATSPHGGGYKTKIEALPASLAGAPLREMAQRIDGLHETIVLRAEAIVQGDVAVDAVLDQFARGRATAHTVVAAIRRQADETDSLLTTTTRYNLTIAGYALAVLPGGTPRDKLVGALVVDRTAIASRP